VTSIFLVLDPVGCAVADSNAGVIFAFSADAIFDAGIDKMDASAEMLSSPAFSPSYYFVYTTIHLVLVCPSPSSSHG